MVDYTQRTYTHFRQRSLVSTTWRFIGDTFHGDGKDINVWNWNVEEKWGNWDVEEKDVKMTWHERPRGHAVMESTYTFAEMLKQTHGWLDVLLMYRSINGLLWLLLHQ